MLPDLQIFAKEDFCYLTTIGRVSGRSHTIEIWFALNERTLYMLSGGRDKSDWVKNAIRSPGRHASSTILKKMHWLVKWSSTSMYHEVAMI
jgi:hypothetical protein